MTVWESFKAISDTHTHPPLLFPGIDWIGLGSAGGPQGPSSEIPAELK